MGDFSRAGFGPNLDVVETRDAYVFEADVPGVEPSDLGSRFRAIGSRSPDGASRITSSGTPSTPSARTFVLPDGVDLANARSELAEGVLAIVVPNKPAAYTKHEIEVSTKASKA